MPGLHQGPKSGKKCGGIGLKENSPALNFVLWQEEFALASGFTEDSAHRKWMPEERVNNLLRG